MLNSVEHEKSFITSGPDHFLIKSHYEPTQVLTITEAW